MMAENMEGLSRRGDEVLSDMGQCQGWVNG